MKKKKKKKKKKRNVTASDIFTNLSDLMTMPVGMSVETWLLIINPKGKFKVTFFLMVQKNLLPKYTMDCGNNKAMNSVLATNYMLNGTQTIFCYLDNYRRVIILFTDISKVTFLTLRTLSIEIQNFTFFFAPRCQIQVIREWFTYLGTGFIKDLFRRDIIQRTNR